MPLIRVDEETKLALESYRLKLAYDTQWGGGNSMNSALRALLGLDHGIERKVRLTTAGALVNHPYHIRMEQFARQISVPSPGDNSPGAKWFYQRMRSQYLDEKARLPRSEHLRFELEYPKRQVFSATDLAKFLNVWCGKPHVVSRGAWKNLDDFASSVDKAWEQSEDQFNESYYRQAIAKAIIYRTVEKLVSHQPWLQTVSRSHVVAYAIAKLSFDLDEANTPINFEKIWGSQRISDALAEALTVAAEAAYTVISNVCGTNVGEWAKQQDCWARVSSLKIDYPKTLKEDLLTKAEQLKEDGRSDFHVSSVNLTRTGKMPTTFSSPEELGVELAHQEETQGADLGYIGRFGGGFKTAMAVGRPESSDEVIQNLLDGLFSGALDRGIDLQLSRDGSGRWISFPDNFMSILLQPRNKALLVTVYGKPESFDDLGHTLQMKADRAPYSRFHIRSTQDLPTALDIIETSLKLRSQKVHGNAPRFEPMSTIDAKPLRLTSSFLAMPAGLDVTSIIGQQIRSQGANRCLIVVSNNAIAEEMRVRLFGRFSLPFRVSDNVGDVRGGRFLPAEIPKSLFIATHALFKELRSADSPQSRQETSWDMVAIDGIQELLKDEPWWDTAGRDLLKSREFTRHLSIISSPAIFKRPEILETIRDLLDQRPLPYWYEACEPRDTFKDTAHIEEFAATLPMDEHARLSDPTSFLERTYFTQALTQTIRDVVGRMNGEDSPLVVRVGGHFGGGKTHTLMTLYHLVNNPEEANRNVNVQDALQGLNIPDDARAFFINGAEIGTTPVIAGLPNLWSELAHQVDLNLFTSLIEDPDGRHRPPNTALYQRILEAASPGVILVDETEAYIRTVNASSEERHSQLSAQSLNDLIRLSYSVVGITVVFANSETEDEYFDRSRLEMALELDERLTATRTPVDDDEILEVVKKRIFKEIDQETGNEVAAAYHRLYMSAPDQFDILVSNPPYTDRLANAYPFHPQLIDLLSTDLQDSGPSSKPGLRRLLQTLAGVVANQWVSRQSAYSIQPSHLNLGDGCVRTLLGQYERPEDGQHRLAALDHIRERLTEEFMRADPQGQRGSHTYNHSPLLRSVANAVFASTLRPSTTTPSQICLAVADPDIRPEHIHEALYAPAFRLLLGPPPNPASNIMHLYQVNPNPLITSGFLTEVTMPPANRAEALDFLVRMNLEPFWDGGRPLFRKIAERRGYNVTRQSREQTWPKLIELLELDTKADADRVRKEVKGRLGI